MSRVPKITAAKSFALLGAMLGALAPQATISQTPGANGPEVRAPQAQNQNQTGMTQSQATRANQALGIEGGFHGFGGSGRYTTIHTFPAWNQRKARRRSRQTGRKIQKRYAR